MTILPIAVWGDYKKQITLLIIAWGISTGGSVMGVTGLTM